MRGFPRSRPPSVRLAHIIFAILPMQNHPHCSLISLLFSISIISTPNKPSPLLNVDGNELRVGVEYYMVSSIHPDGGGGGGGGTTLACTSNKTCPLNVVQERFDHLHGLSLTLHPVNSQNNKFVPASTDLNIQFKATTECDESTVWKVDDYNKSTGKHLITMGGVVGEPEISTHRSLFKIEDIVILGYLLRDCPSLFNRDEKCKDVGIYFGENWRRLALIDEGDQLSVIFTIEFIRKSRILMQE